MSGLNGLMPPVQRVDEYGFRHETGFAFNHDDGIAGSGEHDIKIAALQLLDRGVDHEFAIHTTVTSPCDRARQREWGKGRRRQKLR